MYRSNISVSGWDGGRETHFSPLTEQLLILTGAVGLKNRAGALMLLNRNLTCCILSLLFSTTDSILQNRMESKMEK